MALLTLAAVGVGLAQWLPASAELALTTRSGALDVHEVLRWSFVAPQWVAAIAPGILQERIQPGTSLWLLWNGPNALAPWNVSPYLGPLLLVSCLLGARHRRSRIACGVFAVSILFSLGDALPMLARLLEAAPFLALFRYPSKLLLPATLAATVAAGIALQRLARHPANERRAFLAVGGVVAGALAAAMAWLILAPGTVDGWASTSPLRESTGAALPTLSSLLAFAILQGLAPLLAALALIGVRGKWAALLPGLVFLDLVLAAPTALAVGPRLENLVSPFVDFGPHAVLCHSSEVFKVTVRLNEETGVWSENVTLRALAVPNLNACDGLSGAIGYSVLQTRLNARLEAAVNARSAAATRALGCTHLVARGAPPDEVTRAVASRLDVPLIRISEIADPLPEAFVALRPALVADEKELGERLLSAHGAAATLALADDPLNRLSPGLPLPEGESVSIGRLQRTHASRARLELIGSGGAVVGVRTSFQVGWRAVQAGRALPVIRVGGQHLGAIVADAAAGPIDFEYSPPRLIAGTVAALIGLLLAAGVIAAARKRRQPSAAPDGSSLPDREGGERGQPGE